MAYCDICLLRQVADCGKWLTATSGYCHASRERARSAREQRASLLYKATKVCPPVVNCASRGRPPEMRFSAFWGYRARRLWLKYLRACGETAKCRFWRPENRLLNKPIFQVSRIREVRPVLDNLRAGKLMVAISDRSDNSFPLKSTPQNLLQYISKFPFAVTPRKPARLTSFLDMLESEEFRVDRRWNHLPISKTSRDMAPRSLPKWQTSPHLLRP